MGGDYGRTGDLRAYKWGAIEKLEQCGVTAVEVENQLALAVHDREELDLRVASERVQKLDSSEGICEVEFDLLQTVGGGAVGGAQTVHDHQIDFVCVGRTVEAFIQWGKP